MFDNETFHYVIYIIGVILHAVYLYLMYALGSQLFHDRKNGRNVDILFFIMIAFTCLMPAYWIILFFIKQN